MSMLDHAHPEHLPVADFDIVLADVFEPAVIADAEYREATRHLADRAAVAHRQARDVRGDQQSPARIDVEITAMNAAGVDVLDQRRGSGRRVDGKHRQAVLAADKEAFAADFSGA